MNTEPDRKVVVYTHLGFGDMLVMNGAIRYIARQYDEVLVICKRRYQKEVSTMYSDNTRIHLCIIDDDADLHPWAYTQKLFQDKGYDVMGCGLFSNKERPPGYVIPYSFYDDLEVPRECLVSCFSFPRTQEAIDIANKITVPYIVVHEESSIVKIPITHSLREQGETRLILDVNKNVYPKNSPYWALAEQAVNIPFFNLACLIEKAEELHMIESSVYNLSIHLDLSGVKKKVVYLPDLDGLCTFTGSFDKFTIGPRLKPYEYRSKV